MTPPKRKTAKIQDILNNPVKSNQPALRYKREGFWGWLSYLGFSMMIMLTLSGLIAEIVEYYSRIHSMWGISGRIRDITFPLFHGGWVPVAMAVGFILSLITIWKSPYRFPRLIKWGILWILGFFIFVASFTGFFYCLFGWGDLPPTSAFMIIRDNMELFITLVIIWTWLSILIWYIHYFYKKSHDGYRRVWLKVLISSFIPFLPLLYFYSSSAVIKIGEADNQLIIESTPHLLGDVLSDPPSDFGSDN